MRIAAVEALGNREAPLLEPEGEGQEIALGYDPEETHFPSEKRLLRDDGQVARVLLALGEVDGP